MKKFSLLILFFVFNISISSNLFFKWRVTDKEEEQLKEKISGLFTSNYDLYEKMITNIKTKKKLRSRILSQNPNKDDEDEPILMSSRYSHCQKCIFFVKEMIKIKNQYGFNALYSNSKKELCKLLKNLNIFEIDGCEGLMNIFSPLAIETVFEKYFENYFLCEKIELCPSQNPNKYLDPDDYALNVTKDKKQFYKEKERIKNTTKLRVLQITDIHLDLEYNEKGIANCKYPMCCRDNVTNEDGEEEEEETCGKYGYEGKSDLSKEIFESFLNDSLKRDIDFILWTGDNAPHDIWKGNQEETYKITEKIVKRFNEKYSNKDIYFCLGNHERFPCDNFQDNETELLEKYSSIYKNYLTDGDAFTTFQKNGYYSIKRENDNLVIISINCLLCDSVNFHLINGSKTNTLEMFNWLEGKLKYAEDHNYFVYIINHFPLNGDFNLAECAKRFQALFDRYEYTIRGIFSGHTHKDDIEGITEYFNKDKIIHLNFIAPPLTTFEYMLPSYRIYIIDNETKRVIDYEQYRFDLEGSKKGRCKLYPIGTEKSCWYLAYIASEFYMVHNLSEYDNIIKYRDMEKYVINRYAGSKLGEEYSKDPNWKKIGKCNMITNNFEDYIECCGTSLGVSMDYIALVTAFFIGPLQEKE